MVGWSELDRQKPKIDSDQVREKLMLKLKTLIVIVVQSDFFGYCRVVLFLKLYVYIDDFRLWMSKKATDIARPTYDTQTFIARVSFAREKKQQHEGTFYIFRAHIPGLYTIAPVQRHREHAFNIFSIISWVLFLFLFAKTPCFCRSSPLLCQRLFNRDV